MARSMRHLLWKVLTFVLATMLAAGASVGPVFAEEPAAPDSAVKQPATTDPAPSAPVTTTHSPTAPPVSSAERTPVTEEPRPDLQVSVAFDKPTYDARDRIGVQINITNVGSAPASDVHASARGNVDIAQNYFVAAILEPHANVVVDRVGALTSYDADKVARLTVEVASAEPDLNPGDNKAEATAPVTIVYGTYSGTVYGDGNGNKVMEPNEALPGAEVALTGGIPKGNFSRRTDAQGRFTFTDIPVGEYRVKFTAPGWSITPDFEWFTIDGIDDPVVKVRALLPVSEVLTASIALTKSTYRVGDIAHLIVRLTNSGAVPLPGITASSYYPGGDSSHPGWGPLNNRAPGVTVPARSTSTIDVSIPVTQDAFALGWLTVHCTFGAPPWSNHIAEISTAARVPGGVAFKAAGLLYDVILGSIMPHVNKPVPNTTLYLRNRETGQLVARSTTDSAGRFQFTNLPADTYALGVVGPWRIWKSEGTGDPQLTVRAGENGEISHWVLVIPGPSQPDPGPVPSTVPPVPPAEAPQPARSGAAGLAWTGANVIPLAIAGLLALALGTGLVWTATQRHHRRI